MYEIHNNISNPQPSDWHILSVFVISALCPHGVTERKLPWVLKPEIWCVNIFCFPKCFVCLMLFYFCQRNSSSWMTMIFTILKLDFQPIIEGFLFVFFHFFHFLLHSSWSGVRTRGKLCFIGYSVRMSFSFEACRQKEVKCFK